jgi:hypothetical protein
VARAAATGAARIQRTEAIGGSSLQYAKLTRGHELRLGGKQLNDVLVREGLLSKDMIGRESVMALKLEWT